MGLTASGAQTPDLSVTVTPGANTAGTITLTGVPGKYHYITSLHIQRTATAGLAGSGALSVTTGNLTGSPQWQFGNVMVAGGTQVDLTANFAVPLKSAAAGTNTTFSFPQPGAAVGWNATCWYFLGD